MKCPVLSLLGYSSQVPDIDKLTEKLLDKINIDFAKTKIPPQLSEMAIMFADFFHHGIIYTTNSVNKGELLQKILEKTGYRPSKIVLVDDKLDSLNSVESAMKKFGIEFIGFAYLRTAKEHVNFDPVVANIQLDCLMTKGIILSDDEAAQIKVERFTDVNPDAYFIEIVQKWNFQK